MSHFIYRLLKVNERSFIFKASVKGFAKSPPKTSNPLLVNRIIPFISLSTSTPLRKYSVNVSTTPLHLLQKSFFLLPYSRELVYPLYFLRKGIPNENKISTEIYMNVLYLKKSRFLFTNDQLQKTHMARFVCALLSQEKISNLFFDIHISFDKVINFIYSL